MIRFTRSRGPLNCPQPTSSGSRLRDADRNIVSPLDGLEALRLASNTIIVLTADHGDLDGAHRLHSKGAKPIENRTMFRSSSLTRRTQEASAAGR
jgi:hypothetical protein